MLLPKTAKKFRIKNGGFAIWLDETKTRFYMATPSFTNKNDWRPMLCYQIKHIPKIIKLLKDIK